MRDAAIDTSRSSARGAGRARVSGAPLLDDMVGESAVGRAAPRRGPVTSAAIAAQRLGGGRAGARSKRGPNFAARLRARLPRVRPLKIVTIAAFGVALVGIVANAMVFQRGHHPSPLFGLGHTVDGAPEVAAAVPAPALPAPIEKTGTIPAPAMAQAAPADPAPPAVAPAPKPAPVHHAAAKVHREDPAARTAERPVPAGGHPRPGHAAALHAPAEPRTDAKADPLARLLADASHPAKPAAKAAPQPEVKAATAAKPSSKPSGKPDGKAAPEAAHPPKAAAAGPAVPPHHRLAAGTPAAKPAAESE